MSSASLTDIQAASAAVSALTAAYLVNVAVRQNKERKRARNTDLVQEQLQRIVDALGAIRAAVRESASLSLELDVAIAKLAAALAMRPIALPICATLTDDDMPRPPYAMGDTEAWDRLDSALGELRAYARDLSAAA